MDTGHTTSFLPDAFRDTPVLVTGGAGFIGSHLVHRLVGLGARVRVLDDLSTGRTENIAGLDVELIEGSVLDPAPLQRAVAGCRFVLHQAAFVSVAASIEQPDRCRRDNVDGTAAVLAAAREAGVARLVNASSAAIYGDRGDAPITESDPADPHSPYASSKLEAERICRDERGNVDTLSLRYFNVFGPRQRIDSAYAAVIPAFVSAVCAGRPVTIFGDGGQTRDFISCRLVVDAVLTACTSTDPFGGIACNIGSGHERSIASLLESVCRLAGAPAEVVHAAERPGDIRHSRADVRLARTRLGLPADDSFEPDLRAVIDWILQSAAG